VKHSSKKLIDLKKRASQPLIVQRAERMQRNVLRLRKISAREIVNVEPRRFDFRRREKISSENKIYLPAEKNLAKKSSRLKVVLAALAVVFFLNFVGILGSGKHAVEHTISTAFSGISDLIVAAESFAAGDFADSQNRFAEAVTVLREAEKDLMVLGGAGAVLETQPEKVQAGSRLVSAGKLLASGGEKFAEAANEINLAFSNWKIRQQALNEGKSVESFSQQLHSPIAKILAGISELESAAALLNLVETDSLPVELQQKVAEANSGLNYFLEVAQPLAEALPQLPNFLGDKVPRRYLILFQNPDEIRPTGGFVGSVGILNLNDGFAEKFEIRDVYEIDGQLAEHLNPPEGFGFITGSWGLRDVNYHPDFPTSAEAAAVIFEEAGFGSVDGVAAVNSTFLTKLAAAAADGVQLDRFSRKIEAEDLTLLLSLIIETKTDGAEKPKQILDEVWAALRQDLQKIPATELAGIALDSIMEKEIQFASTNPDLQKIARAVGVANELAETEGDYLFVVNTSLSGNKSDRFCSNEISHTTEISAEGDTIDTLKILRKHAWSEAEERRMENLAEDFGIRLPEELKEILGRGRNIDLVKVFVPLGSELISVEGLPKNRVETKNSTGKTYFMFSLTVQPKFSREVVLKYRLPIKFEEKYSFLGEFQSGDSEREVEKVVRKDGVEIFEEKIDLGTERTFVIPAKTEIH